MYLLGVGSAFPSNKLSDGILKDLGAGCSTPEQMLIERIGVTERSVSLPVDFVRAANGADIVEARKAASVSPTALGVEAANRAMAQAGISIEQVGFVVADCATPYQTCPSEAQRIAGSFGVKVPSYDLTMGAAAVPMVLNTLASWRDERLPEYVLFVSTNTPSVHVRYGFDPLAARIFGDAACALVISRKHQGAWRVVSTTSRAESSRHISVVVERNASVSPASVASSEFMKDAVRALMNEGEGTTEGYFIGTGILDREFRELVCAVGVAQDRVVSVVPRHGYSLGSSAGAALADVWDKALSGERVSIVHCGDGLSAKVVLVRN